MLNDDDLTVSPPPDWLSGDFHSWMYIEEIEELVELPEKEDIEEELWNQLREELQTEGFQVPTILTKEGDWDIELFHSPERVAVARDLGIDPIPVALFEPPPLPNSISLCRRLIRTEFEDENALFRVSNFGGPPPPDDPPPTVPPPVTP